MGITVELCMNPDVIRALYDDPFVQDRYGESSYYGFRDVPGWFYLAGRDEDGWKCCALCILKTQWDIEVHLCIPEASKRLAKEFSAKVCDKLFGELPINRISTTVVDVFPQVANFVERLGFKKEGTARAACKRDGRLHDLWCYSLLRGEEYGWRRR